MGGAFVATQNGVDDIMTLQTDFRERKAERIGRASGNVLEEVLSILDECIY